MNTQRITEIKEEISKLNEDKKQCLFSVHLNLKSEEYSFVLKNAQRLVFIEEEIFKLNNEMKSLLN